jgi:glycosyltransferase involved in cell wall biosynthesis
LLKGKKMKVAIIYDWLVWMGGGERCLEIFCELFPDATIYTLLYYPDKITSDTIKHSKIETSFIQKMPFAKHVYRKYLPLFPTAIEQFDLRGYDLILSFSHCVAKGVITPPDTCHISYCCTPMRYAWDFYHEYFSNGHAGHGLSKFFIPFLINYLRTWDVVSANRVDHYIAISNYVKTKIEKYYNRSADLIYPPANTDFYLPVKDPKRNFYLIVSRLVPQKRIDLAIKAFNELSSLSLVIVGTGPELSYLKSIAKPNIKFLGWQSDETIREYYANAKAFLMPGEEEFGITPLEAQACGTPVIAFNKGGAVETVVDNETGVLFEPHTVPALINAIKKIDSVKFNPAKIREWALKFSRENFKTNLKNYIDQKYTQFKNKK